MIRGLQSQLWTVLTGYQNELVAVLATHVEQEP
jgi:hypothetical protein